MKQRTIRRVGCPSLLTIAMPGGTGSTPCTWPATRAIAFRRCLIRQTDRGCSAHKREWPGGANRHSVCVAWLNCRSMLSRSPVGSNAQIMPSLIQRRRACGSTHVRHGSPHVECSRWVTRSPLQRRHADQTSGCCGATTDSEQSLRSAQARLGFRAGITSVRDGRHKRVQHARARTVRQYVAGACLAWHHRPESCRR